MPKLSDTTRNKLKSVSTATVATALFKRGFRIQMIQDVHPLSADQPTMVGEAFTLRYMPAREDLNTIEVFRDRAHPQRKAIEDCPVGAVLVMDSRKDARAASAGAILVTRLMKRGCAGVVTDGGIRSSTQSIGPGAARRMRSRSSSSLPPSFTVRTRGPNLWTRSASTFSLRPGATTQAAPIASATATAALPKLPVAPFTSTVSPGCRRAARNPP